jgi:hypothetical protein
MRSTTVRLSLTALVLATLAPAAHAGPYAGAAGQAGSTAVAKDSPTIVTWASAYGDYTPGPNVSASFATPGQALGAATGVATDVVSLGDRGSITLTFGGRIFDGPGVDFAVFENSFSDTFLELAWVEVSSDGNHFFRFPGFSFTPGPVGGFGAVDPTDIDGLAGKYRGGYGTPFDLALLAAVPGLDVQAVSHVRLVDIVGDGSVFDHYPAVLGGPHPIHDVHPTVASGGFDLDGVGVMHFVAAPVPEPSTLALGALGGLLLTGFARRGRGRRAAAGLAVAALALPAAAAGGVSTFEDVGVGAEGYWFPAVTTTFRSGAASFTQEYTDFGIPGCCWTGWTVSSVTDNVTPGFGNQYSAFAGGGQGGSAQYGIAFPGDATVRFDTPQSLAGAWFTNTTYAATSMRDGDGFAKRFGGATGSDPDFLRLTIIGLDGGGAATGSVDFLLADYRFADTAMDYIVSDWTYVDLSSLGPVAALGFSLASTDNGAFGMNTPAYFAMDDLAVAVTAVPEPAAAWLLAGGLGVVGIALRRRRAIDA